MRVVRRALLLCVPALCTLVSCGIPATGVVEAGGPAHGIVPMVRVYFLQNGSLVAVPRRPVGTVDAESAVKRLLEGPTDVERAKRLTTLLPPLTAAPTIAPVPVTSMPPASGLSGASAAEAPASASATVSVNARSGVVSIQLHTVREELTDLAMAQLICTAAEAQRATDAGTGTGTVTVKVTNALGRSVEGSGERCPEG
ncbi:hypothetical protein [Streptomyces sp. NPDC060002]|uniref:hypothetical protein n=1 Tax=Streptomyces sp. NPDC060002 TaxID=3347033 RepID=UPI0036927B01